MAPAVGANDASFSPRRLGVLPTSGLLLAAAAFLAAFLAAPAGVDAGLLGAPAPVDLGADESSNARVALLEAAHFATERICDKINSKVHLKFIRLIDATQQVVQGLKYAMNIEVGETNCLKAESDASMCLEDAAGVPRKRWRCAVSVWSRRWLQAPDDLMVIGEPECSPTERK